MLLLVLPHFFDWRPATTIRIIAGLDVVMMSAARIRFGVVVVVSLVVFFCCVASSSVGS